MEEREGGREGGIAGVVDRSMCGESGVGSPEGSGESGREGGKEEGAPDAAVGCEVERRRDDRRGEEWSGVNRVQIAAHQGAYVEQSAVAPAPALPLTIPSYPPTKVPSYIFLPRLALVFFPHSTKPTLPVPASKPRQPLYRTM